MSRLPDLSLDRMTPEQRRVHDAVMGGPRGVVRGPVRAWLRNPGLAEPAQALGAYCRFGTSLARRLSELAILVTAVHWRAGYEWRAHLPLALEAGVSEAVADALRRGLPPPFERDDERAVHDFAVELLTARTVGDDTWRQAQAALGEAGVLDLVGVLGYYALISMTLKAYRIGAEPADEVAFGTG